MAASRYAGRGRRRIRLGRHGGVVDLLAAVYDKKEPRHIVYQPEFVVRASTSAPENLG
jgi:hypothetical protein